MRIAIIGGGWVGCHLAWKLKDKHDITIFEKNEELFMETSYNNQNRLHYGYHYSRNNKTRELCKNTFDRFLIDYDFLSKELNANYYCVPHRKSIIDFETYKKIFLNFNYLETDFKLKNIDGCIKTNERWIDFEKAKKFFNHSLNNNFLKKEVDDKEIKKLRLEYDYVINATNNMIKDKTIKDNFYELTLSLLYEKKQEINFDAITLVDGKFFSLYPYKDNLYTLTDVEHTPLKKFKKIKSLIKYKNRIENSEIEHKKNIIEQKVKDYYKNFNNDFVYVDHVLSIKSKINDKSDDRYPIISRIDNYISCFTGKIQGIYIIEDFINDILNIKSNDER